MTIIRATAHTNIALIKYWGKSLDEGNLPATGSFSLTLDKFFTTTSVKKIDQQKDIFTLNEQPVDSEAQRRVVAHVDFFRTLTGRDDRFLIHSVNQVPTKAGLASSASGFAALTVALNRAFELNLSGTELSKVARRGSGSAARSIFENLVLMHGGPHVTDEEAYAEPIATAPDFDLSLIVLECARSPKPIGSRDAMTLTSKTSIFYQPFLERHPRLLQDAVAAAKDANLEALGLLMEQSTMQMHATMLGCNPPFWYFNAATMTALHEVRRLRQVGHSCFFTMDAGPHVKVLCKTSEAGTIAKTLAKLEGISNITVCGPGPGAYLHD